MSTVNTATSRYSGDLASATVTDAAVGDPAPQSHGRRRSEPEPPARTVRTRRLASKAAGVAGRAAFTIVLIVAALVFLFLAVGPRFLNYQTSTMLTGSMSPGSTRATSSSV